MFIYIWGKQKVIRIIYCRYTKWITRKNVCDALQKRFFAQSACKKNHMFTQGNHSNGRPLTLYLHQLRTLSTCWSHASCFPYYSDIFVYILRAAPWPVIHCTPPVISIMPQIKYRSNSPTWWTHSHYIVYHLIRPAQADFAAALSQTRVVAALWVHCGGRLHCLAISSIGYMDRALFGGVLEEVVMTS